MITRLLSLLLLLLISLPTYSQDWHWVKDAGGSGYSESKRIATDADGNSYVTGNFAGSVTFGTITLTGNSNGEAFLVKYDNSGTLKWAKQMGATSVVESMDIAVDGNGNSYLTGNFKGTATVGAFTLFSPDDRAAFVVKLDATGNVLWAKQANSTEGDDVWGENITVDGSGNVYVTGSFFNSVTFGATTITATRDEQVFIAKYTANGNLAWVKMAGGLGSCFTHDITTDQTGNLYLTGQFWLTAAFGSTTLYKYDAINTSGEIFIAKYDASGNALWAKQAGGAGSDAATGIAVDSNGNSYLTGFFQETATFGSTSVSGSAGKNVFLAKYSATGSFMWVRKHQASEDAAGTAVDLDASSNIYTTGYFEGSVAFGNATLISYGSYDIFFTKYDANGTVTGAMQAGGAGMDVAKGLDVNANGGIYFTGDFSGPATFGATTLSEGMVVGKLNSVGTTAPPVPTISTAALSSNMLCSGKQMYVYFTTIGPFQGGNSFAAQLSDAQGSFASPIVLGTGFSSPLVVTVPAITPAGAGYRIRVVSSAPAVNGTDNGSNLTLPAALAPLGSVSGAASPCAGASGLIYAVAPVQGAASYIWTVPADWSITGGQGTPSITVSAGSLAGHVAVKATNACQTTAAKSFAVTPVNISLTASVTSDAILTGASTFLLAKGADSYSWSPALGLSDPSIADPVATPFTTTTYTVTGTKNGCTSTASVTVTVHPDPQLSGHPSDWKWGYQALDVGWQGTNYAFNDCEMATDSEGNIYVAGQYGGTAYFGGRTLEQATDGDIFIANLMLPAQCFGLSGQVVL